MVEVGMITDFCIELMFYNGLTNRGIVCIVSYYARDFSSVSSQPSFSLRGSLFLFSVSSVDLLTVVGTAIYKYIT